MRDFHPLATLRLDRRRARSSFAGGEGSGRAAFLVVLFVESGNRFKGHVFPLVFAHDRSFRDNAHEIREELRTIRYGEG